MEGGVETVAAENGIHNTVKPDILPDTNSEMDGDPKLLSSVEGGDDTVSAESRTQDTFESDKLLDTNHEMDGDPELLPSMEGGDDTVSAESRTNDTSEPDKLTDANHEMEGNRENEAHVVRENGLNDSGAYLDDKHAHLVQMITELNLQNEYLKSQFESLKNIWSESEGSFQETKTVVPEGGRTYGRQTRVAAEGALMHLQEAHSEADAKAQELSVKLAEVQQKMDKEIKDHEEKYSELDSKFGRLHKRAKQRIQDVQKEKDDLETRFREVNEMAEKASSQQLALQQELERTRQQANEAMKAIEAERQQLRRENNKLRDNLEEQRRSLEPKQNALEAMQQTLSEKEQMLEDLQGSLQAADEKRQAAITELSLKHQKNIDSLEAQLTDALLDRKKATYIISSLQLLIAEKESKMQRWMQPQLEKEKQSWEAASQALKAKLEIAESNCIHAEIEAAKLRSQLELELSMQTQQLNTRDAELVAAKEEIHRLEAEFSSYKARAHALLQKKDAELTTARDSELLKAQEETLKEAEKEIMLASAERDNVLQELGMDEALSNAEQQIKMIAMKLDSAHARHQSDKEAWEISLQNVEETW
ncbi:hypothetical protein RJ641_010818 [Dillenia turbinata]|uniref:Uncharacterized protein n=1 Tax=Dillenia turbinata TaxID=194707 RepID=A0AAN8Z130_9MAGN